MKKILHTFLICLGIMMISSQTFAQNADGEKLRPFVGNTYTYSFTLADGLGYEFYLSTTKDGVGVKDDGLTGLITGATGTVSGGKAEASISWPTTGLTLKTEIYLFIKVSGDGTTVCDNYNAVGITPIANAFDLTIADNTPSTTSGESCPTTTGLKAVVAPTTNPAYVYDAGTTTLTYEFTKSGNVNKWNFDFDIDQTGTGDYTYTFNGTTIPSADDDIETDTNVSINGLSNNVQILTIVVDNVPGETPVFTININSATDAETNVTPASYPTITHTIKTMPIIGAFN